MRDVYEYYGYDFHYYQGQPVDKIQVLAWVRNFEKMDYFIRQSINEFFIETVEVQIAEQMDHGKVLSSDLKPGYKENIVHKMVNSYMQQVDANRLKAAEILMGGLRFVNKNGQPLHMMKKLELDPALLEQPLYR